MANPIIPPPGITGVFSRIMHPRVTPLGLPYRKKILVIETTPGMADHRAKALLAEIAGYNQVQSFVDNGDEERLVLKLSGFSPDIVFLPHPDSPSPQNQALIGTVASCMPNKMAFHYETPDMNDFFNLYVLFDDAGMEHKMRCIAPFKSQLERVRFDLAAKYAALQAAAEIRPMLPPEFLQYKYAERFVMGGFMGGEGEFKLYGKNKLFLSPHSDWRMLRGLKALVGSPHHDDLEIPMAFTASQIHKRGTLLHNLILTTGKEGVAGDLPWISKHMLRHQEVGESSSLMGVIPIDLALAHDFPEARPAAIWEKSAKMIFYGFLMRFNPQVIFLPLKDDPHPDHQLMHRLMMETAREAFLAGDWSFAGFPNVIFYASPWYSGIHGTNAYFWFDQWETGRDEASMYASMVNAIVGTELSLNQPGATPPGPEDFGGIYAERFLIRRLPISSIRYPIRGKDLSR